MRGTAGSLPAVALSKVEGSKVEGSEAVAEGAGPELVEAGAEGGKDRESELQDYRPAELQNNRTTEQQNCRTSVTPPIRFRIAHMSL